MKLSDRQYTALFFSAWLFAIVSATILNRFVFYPYLSSALGLGAVLSFAVIVCLPLLLLSNRFARKSHWKIFSILTLVLIIHHILVVIVGVVVLLVTIMRG